MNEMAAAVDKNISHDGISSAQCGLIINNMRMTERGQLVVNSRCIKLAGTRLTSSWPE